MRGRHIHLPLLYTPYFYFFLSSSSFLFCSLPCHSFLSLPSCWQIGAMKLASRYKLAGFSAYVAAKGMTGRNSAWPISEIHLPLFHVHACVYRYYIKPSVECIPPPSHQSPEICYYLFSSTFARWRLHKAYGPCAINGYHSAILSEINSKNLMDFNWFSYNSILSCEISWKLLENVSCNYVHSQTNGQTDGLW